MPFQVIGPKQVRDLWPLVELGDGLLTAKIVGALYHPDDGHIAPADLTMALRKGARARGAEIHEARQTGRMFGLNVPSIPVEHQYVVYDESSALKAYRQRGGRELAVLRESDQSYYLREERMGCAGRRERS